jgi:LytS/YehU family sensor histidine kinase
MSLAALAPRILISSCVLAACFVLASNALANMLSGRVPFASSAGLRALLMNSINFWVVFLIWEIIYFSFHTFRSWKLEEIKNLQLRAAKTEIELNSFKAQLNPHFIFNALNSIRALVDENPAESKRAITMLSGILRGTLTLGRQQVVALGEELDMVAKYLAMEKIRFEERLSVSMTIEPELSGILIPPFMIQTLVENGIKHGISKRTKGGELRIAVSRDQGFLNVVIENSGEFRPNPGQEGIGIANTRNRLSLLYADRASLTHSNRNGMVRTELIIPIQ